MQEDLLTGGLRTTLTAQDVLNGLAALELGQYILLKLDDGSDIEVRVVSEPKEMKLVGELIPCLTQDKRLCFIVLPPALERSENVLTATVLLEERP